MKATMTGTDGKMRSVRAVRCSNAATLKKESKWIITKSTIENPREFVRRLRNCIRRAKNAPGRYARRSARLSAIRSA